MTKEIKNMIANINAIEMSENKMKVVSSKAEKKGKKAKCERGRNREMTSWEEFDGGGQAPRHAGTSRSWKRQENGLSPKSARKEGSLVNTLICIQSDAF